MHCTTHIIIIVTIMYSFFPGIQAEEIRQQYFRVLPKSIRAQEGSEVTLQCEIEFLRGRVQWTKDGYALGELTYFFLSFLCSGDNIPYK